MTFQFLRHVAVLVAVLNSFVCAQSPLPSFTRGSNRVEQLDEIINADGTGHGGFKRRGYHFSPQAAWPYVQERVTRIVAQVPYSAWFVDCDATAECFEDFSPDHPATRIDDTRLRRERLSWLRAKHRIVVGSEGGSILFADVIDFGHGVHTPYIGHLDAAFTNPASPSFLGKHWPPDRPDLSFKPVPVPLGLKTPYFDPTVRIPLYQAALGDEVIDSHHWSLDSMKLSDVQQTRELMEILYMVPPMYHLNRETWPKRRDHILEHYAFWSPLHRELACAPLKRFECLSDDRLVQRTTFETRTRDVSITVNFGDSVHASYPSHSATVAGALGVRTQVYVAKP